VGINQLDNAIVSTCFWDVQNSGLINMCGSQGDEATGCDNRYGKTTAEMQTASTFLDAGWDFVGEMTNGPNDIWWIFEGRDYPRLWWEKLYVDDDATGDPLENGRQEHPFDTIQEAIDVAPDYLTILVRPGEYGKIDFKGKAITVAGTEGAAVIGGSSSYGGRLGSTTTINQDAVTFHAGEGPDSVLKNFVISEYSMAISLNYGSSPTIRNITIVNNQFGIAAYEGANPDISNCIFWNNEDGDMFQCEARYSCFEVIEPGQGNISVDPLFVDPVNGDYHLKSEGWRWNTSSGSWTWDDVTSRCIDAGDPDLPLGDEPMSVPRDPTNEYGANRRINMGAYGGTAQASMPPLGWVLPEYETIAPEPNPAQWAPGGEPREVYEKVDGVPGYWAQMTTAEATDASGFVQYFFECTTNSDFNSGWQSSRTYSVLMGFLPQTLQEGRFRVKARDLYDNQTEWSEELTAD
jgi:parallel beta-helix repeat protein